MIRWGLPTEREHEAERDHCDFRNGAFSLETFFAEHEICSTRRGLPLGPLPAALPWLARRCYGPIDIREPV
jgi:hypothetical protein